MRILDRSIISRFLWNFLLLFALLFMFATAVDAILEMDKFITPAVAGAKNGVYANRVTGFISLLVEYNAPRIFQFYQFMAGLLCIAAMGFTFVQMHRARELVAIMAAGVPLRRCVWAVLGAALVLNGFQVINQEFILPRLADRLISGHKELGKEDPSSFTVPLTRDSSRNLLYATKFVPGIGRDDDAARLEGFLALERNDKGQLLRRITARAAKWDGSRSSWILEDGTALHRDPASMESVEVQTHSRPLAEYKTDLSPKVLTARHSVLFAQLLSTPELSEIAAAGAIEESTAHRMQLGRWGTVLVNLLALVIAVPFFLQRGPVNMLQQSIWCAASCVPAIILSAVLMTLPVEGLPTTVMVALPLAVLLPVASARLSWLPS